MKRFFYIIVSCLFIFSTSCIKKSKQQTEHENISKDLLVEKTTDKSNNISQEKKDFILELNEKVQPNYNLIKNNEPNNGVLQKTLNRFILRNKNLFKPLKSEQESKFNVDENDSFVFVREWTFEDALSLKKVQEKLEARFYVDKKYGKKHDVLKEPHFVYVDSLKLYVFYVNSVYNTKHVLAFKEILENWSE